MPNTLTPNMSLILPTVGQEPGPNWALDINSSFSILDQHNHSNGNGVQIIPSGLNINSDLTFLSNNATNLRSARFSIQASPLALASDIGCIYVSGSDLYYNDTLGNQVRLTIAGAVNGTPGSIGGLVAPASVTYVPGTQTYIFQSAVNTSGFMDVGPLTIRNVTASSNGITITPPSPLASNYTITLPANAPASQGIVEMNSSGVMNVSPHSYQSLCPVGSIIMFAGSSAPTGWLFCNGAVVSQTTYADLFASIGTTYNTGGEGAGNFRLPNTQGVFVRGAGSQTIGSETYSGTLGTSQNDATSVNGLSTATAGSHNHGGTTGSSSVPVQFYTANTGFPTNYTATVNNFGVSLVSGTLQGSSHSHSISTDGSHTHTLSGDSETRPANISFNYIIKF